MSLTVYRDGELEHPEYGEVGTPQSFYMVERFGPPDPGNHRLTQRRFMFINLRLDELERRVTNG